MDVILPHPLFRHKLDSEKLAPDPKLRLTFPEHTFIMLTCVFAYAQRKRPEGNKCDES